MTLERLSFWSRFYLRLPRPELAPFRHRMPGASGHDLAVATFQSDQAFGTLANRMVDRGFISRAAGHGRRIEHTLTASGRDALQEGHRIAATVLEDLFAPLNEEQRAALDGALRMLAEGA